LTQAPGCAKIALQEENDIVRSDPEEEATASHLAAPGHGKRPEVGLWRAAAGKVFEMGVRSKYPDREADSNGECCPSLFLTREDLFSL